MKHSPGPGGRIPFVLASLASILLTAGCGGRSGETVTAAGPESGDPAAPTFPPALVQTAAVEERPVEGEVRLVGTAAPWRRATVASEVAGLVERLLVEEGDPVVAGQVLAELRRDLLERLRDRQQEDLLADQAAHRLTVSRKDRNESLLGDGVISPQTFDDSRLVEEEAGHRVASGEAELRRLDELLDKTSIRAPFDGIVVRKVAEVGEWVAVGDGVAEVVDPGRMEVQLAFPERFLGKVRKTGIRVECDALPGVDLPAEWSSLAPDGDPETRTFPLRLEVPNPRGQVRGGMLCRARLPLGEGRPSLLVPKDAVVDDGRSQVVFLVADGLARRIPIEIGAADGDRVEVRGDLAAGALVVVRGNERLQDGQPVQIQAGASGGAGGDP